MSEENSSNTVGKSESNSNSLVNSSEATVDEIGKQGHKSNQQQQQQQQEVCINSDSQSGNVIESTDGNEQPSTDQMDIEVNNVKAENEVDKETNEPAAAASDSVPTTGKLIYLYQYLYINISIYKFIKLIFLLKV